MKPKSFLKMGDSAFNSLRRFPLVIIAASIAAAAGIILADDPESSPAILRLLMCSQLAIPLLLASTLAAERLGSPLTAKRDALLGALVPVSLLVIYYFALPDNLTEADTVRFVQWNIAAHLLVAFLPYLKPGETNGFWQYNLTLASRLLASVFFTVVLFGGLSVALAALDTLFNIDMNDNMYLYVWISLAFVFNTWYYLGGVPSAWRELEQSSHSPKIVQIFGQYILAPLVLVYLVILMAYLAKIIITSVWPSSWVGWLVSGVAVAGLLSLLLVHPQTESQTSRWARRYGRIFHVALIPAVTMLVMAVAKRIGQYGVTEMRYLLMVLAVWLGFIAILGAIRGRISIKTIPASLILLAVLTAIGPLGASTVSRRSQLNRLDSLLIANKRLVDGVFTTSKQEVSLRDNQEIRGALLYLFNYHGMQVLASRSDPELLAELAVDQGNGSSRKQQSRLMTTTVGTHLNLLDVRLPSPIRYNQLVFICDDPGFATGISGYDFSVRLDMNPALALATVFSGQEYVFSRDEGAATIVLSQNSVAVVTIDLAPLVLALGEYPRENYTVPVPAKMLGVDASGEAITVKLVFSELVVPNQKNSTEIVKMVATAFVKIGG